MAAILAPALERRRLHRAAGRPRSKPTAGPGLAPARRSTWRASARGRPGCRRRARLCRGAGRGPERAAEPPEGPLLIAGSNYAISPARRRRLAGADDDDYATIPAWISSAGSELLSMMGLVAAVVAIVILFFFGVGYLFGRLFLESDRVRGRQTAK